MEQFLAVTESEWMHIYADLAVERHNLLCVMPEALVEEGGTEELWRIEDKMAAEWQRLDNTQRQAVGGLASDLSWVRRNGSLAPKSHAVADVSLLHIKMLMRALSEYSVYEALHYIRICRPLTGNHLSAVLRASLYREAFRGVASVVFEKAVGEINPPILKPSLLPSPDQWAKVILDFPIQPLRFFHPHWFVMWDWMLHRHSDQKFLQGDEAFLQPSLANRLAVLMFETMPWPMSMMYLLLVTSQSLEDTNADSAK